MLAFRIHEHGAAMEMARAPGTRLSPYEIVPRSAPRSWGSCIAPAARGAAEWRVICALQVADIMALSSGASADESPRSPIC